MRQQGPWALVLSLALAIVATPAHAARAKGSATYLTARAAIVLDNETGEVLWAHDPDRPLPPASTTKVVTAILAIQSGRMQESFPVSAEAAATPASKLGLKPGMLLRLEDLVYALMLNSANDAAVVIAEGLAGSVPAFARQMNTLARRVGARNTYFVNPHGLPNEQHVSSARDLALLFRYALEFPAFRTIVSTRVGEARVTGGSVRRIALRNHNRLLGEYHLPVVGKTGWTRAAKRCFVGAAWADDRSVSFAVLGSTDLWGDIKRLLGAALEGKTWPEVLPESVQVAQSPARSSGGGDDVRSAVQPPQGPYAVTLGSFRSHSAAEQMRKRLGRAGYRVHIVRGKSNRRPVYRVTIGNFSNAKEAQHVAREIRRRHQVAATVVQR